MKRRTLRIANFIAFNLLFFALYLNFIHKDKSAITTIQTQQPAAFTGTTLVQNPEKYLGKKDVISVSAVEQTSATKTASAN